MADEESTAEAAKPAKSGGIVGKLVNAIGILILVIGGNIATNAILKQAPELAGPATFAEKAPEKTDKKADKKEAVTGPPIYLAMDPPLVASIDDGEAIRFVQITVEVMSRDQATLDAVMAHTPVIRNNLLMLVGRKKISELTTSDAKELLREEALTEIRAILKKMGPVSKDKPLGVLEDLYFTSFVVQ